MNGCVLVRDTFKGPSYIILLPWQAMGKLVSSEVDYSQGISLYVLLLKN